MSVDERWEMERQYRRHESTQARLGGGRLKFTCCWYCGSVDRMQSIHHEVLAEAGQRTVALWNEEWYREPGNDEHLFYACRYCNKDRDIPDGFEPMSLTDIQVWLDRDPMAPDYEALATEPEAATAGQDSRDSAGL